MRETIFSVDPLTTGDDPPYDTAKAIARACKAQDATITASAVAEHLRAYAAQHALDADDLITNVEYALDTVHVLDAAYERLRRDEYRAPLPEGTPKPLVELATVFVYLSELTGGHFFASLRDLSERNGRSVIQNSRDIHVLRKLDAVRLTRQGSYRRDGQNEANEYVSTIARKADGTHTHTQNHTHFQEPNSDPPTNPGLEGSATHLSPPFSRGHVGIHGQLIPISFPGLSGCRSLYPSATTDGKAMKLWYRDVKEHLSDVESALYLNKIDQLDPVGAFIREFNELARRTAHGNDEDRRSKRIGLICRMLNAEDKRAVDRVGKVYDKYGVKPIGKAVISLLRDGCGPSDAMRWIDDRAKNAVTTPKAPANVTRIESFRRKEAVG